MLSYSLHSYLVDVLPDHFVVIFSPRFYSSGSLNYTLRYFSIRINIYIMVTDMMPQSRTANGNSPEEGVEVMSLNPVEDVSSSTVEEKVLKPMSARQEQEHNVPMTKTQTLVSMVALTVSMAQTSSHTIFVKRDAQILFLTHRRSQSSSPR